MSGLSFAQYLDKHKIKQNKAAAELGLSTSFVSRLVEGANASLQVVQKIIKWSNNEISWESFVGGLSDDHDLY